MNKDINIIIKKLIFRSKNRGCKETECIFDNFAISEVYKLNIRELYQYEKLLNVDDFLLYSWFSGLNNVPKKYHNSVYKKLLKFNEEKFKNI